MIIVLVILIILFIIFITNRKRIKQESYDPNPTKIILQAWDQYFISTKSINTLIAEIPELSEYFTDILIPPISKPHIENGVGFFPTELNNFNSNWGSEDDLKKLISLMKKYNLNSMVHLILNHRQGQLPMWFKYENPNYIGVNESYVSPDDYYKYITTNLYDPWGSPTNEPKGVYIDGLPPDYSLNGLKNCYIENTDGSWSLYRDCRNKVPMYDVAGNANPGWLQSVNFCNINVLQDIIKYIKRVKEIGIDGIIIAQADAIDSSIIALFLNSDVMKTPSILQNIKKICKNAESPEVENNVIYTFNSDVDNASIESLTSAEFDRKVIDNFYGELYGITNGEKGWRGLLEMPVEINKYLNKKDWCGQFDYGLKFLLNEMLNTEDFSIDGRVFEKERMIIGYPTFKERTITFVDTHDTDYFNTLFGRLKDKEILGIPGTEINFYAIIPAYFIILLLPGTPMVNKIHYDVYKKLGIQEFIQIRNDCCIDIDSDFEINKSDINDIAWTVSNLNLSIKSKTNKRIIEKIPSNNTKIFVEINNKEPASNNLYSKKLVDKNLWMKITFV